jgi:Mrp family chromosome partitioning ATPase
LSRNFDILQRAEKQHTVVPESTGSLPISGGNGQRPWEHRKPLDEDAVKLVQRLFVFKNSDAPKVVVFAGIQGEASSEICSNAAEALAAQGLGSVCVVDGNLSAPEPHLLEGEKLAAGTDAAGKACPNRDSAVRVGGGSFWVLPDSTGANGQRPLGMDRMRLRMADLRKEFDYVLVDAAPLDLSSDAVLLGQVADGIVLIIEANSTRRENARIVKQNLESAHVKILGAVLNNRTFPIPEALYRKL